MIQSSALARASRRLCLCGLLVATLVLCPVAQSALLAYCVNVASPCLADWKTGGTLNGEPIPIWVITSGRFSITDDPAKTDGSHGVGLASDQFIAEVKAVARAFDEGPAAIHLEYAGEVDSSAWDCRRGGSTHTGIVIGNRDGPSSAPDGCSTSTCGVRVNITSPPDGSTFGTEPFTDVSENGFHSVRSILLHEIAHVFNLSHLHQMCDPANVTDDPNHQEGASQFVSVLNFQLQYPRRDDFEGLVLQYGPNSRELQILSSSSGLPGSWSPTVKNQVLESKVPPSISQPATFSAIVGTSGSDALWVAVDIDGSGYGERQFLASLAISTERARTRYRPAVAVGGGRIAVAWLAEPDKKGSVLALLAVRTWPEGEWVLRDLALFGESGEFQDIGLGYDSVSDRFLVTLRDQQTALPELLVISPDELQLEQRVALGGSVLDLGRTVCQAPSRFSFLRPVLREPGQRRSDCITISVGSPVGIHWVSLARGTMIDGEYQFAGRQGINALSFGGTDLARIGNVLVVSNSRGSGAQILRATVDFPYFPSTDSLETGHWPVAVGGLLRPFLWCLSQGLGLQCSRAEFRIVVPTSGSAP